MQARRKGMRAYEESERCSREDLPFPQGGILRDPPICRVVFKELLAA
jgi:hypothetical protein